MIGNKELLLSGHKSFGAISGQLFAAPSGRCYYRHPSNKGSVMIFNDGKWRAAAILDAIYRAGGLAFGADGIVPSGCKAVTWTNNAKGNNCLSGQKTQTSFAQSQGLSDATLNGLWSKIYDTNTSRQNCDALMQYTGYVKDGITGVPAVEYARRIIFDGMGCDIPNIQLLMRVLSDADFIDSMDDTVKSCPQNALGKLNPYNYFYLRANGDSGGNIWSSTHTNANSVIYIDEMSCGVLGPWGKATTQSGVIPVCEVEPPAVNSMPVPASFGEVRVVGRGGGGCCENVNFQLYYNGADISAQCSNVRARQYWIHFFDSATYDSGFVAVPYNSSEKKFKMTPAQNCQTGPSILGGANVRRLLTVSFTYQGAQREASVLYHNY